MKIINEQKLKNIKYTADHRKAFREMEKQLLGHNTIRGWLHDLDKIFLYLVISDRKKIHKWHRSHSRHHSIKAKTHVDFVQMVIDWECARYTKPDKPLNARETLYKFYPELENKVLPVIEELGL